MKNLMYSETQSIMASLSSVWSSYSAFQSKWAKSLQMWTQRSQRVQVILFKVNNWSGLWKKISSHSHQTVTYCSKVSVCGLRNWNKMIWQIMKAWHDTGHSPTLQISMKEAWMGLDWKEWSHLEISYFYCRIRVKSRFHQTLKQFIISWNDFFYWKPKDKQDQI